MNTVYIATFDMKTSMHSIRNKNSSSLVDKKMISMDREYIDEWRMMKAIFYKCFVLFFLAKTGGWQKAVITTRSGVNK